MNTTIHAYDERREIAIPGDKKATIQFCIEHFINCANEAINDHGYFAVALSGGSTPKAIYQGLSSPLYRDQIDWSRVLLFWSDERCVSPDDSNSNHHMAMEAGFDHLPVPLENIFRMKGEEDPEESARDYEKIITDKLSGAPFDLVMLGMGGDGHTASLFPKTHGLHPVKNRQAIANYIPQLDTWRITLTTDCINQADAIAIYVLGSEKSERVKEVFQGAFNPDLFPVQAIGTARNRSLWIMDDAAASLLIN